MFGVDLRQRHEGSAVHGPAFQQWQFVDGGLAFHDGSAAAWCEPHGPESFQGAGDAGGVFQQPGGVFFELDECFYGAECVAEDEAGAIQRTEQVAGHGELAAADVFEQQSRPAALTDSPMDLGSLEAGVDFAGNSQQLAVFFQISETFLQISVTHRSGSAEREWGGGVLYRDTIGENGLRDTGGWQHSRKTAVWFTVSGGISGDPLILWKRGRGFGGGLAL